MLPIKQLLLTLIAYGKVVVLFSFHLFDTSFCKIPNVRDMTHHKIRNSKGFRLFLIVNFKPKSIKPFGMYSKMTIRWHFRGNSETFCSQIQVFGPSQRCSLWDIKVPITLFLLLIAEACIKQHDRWLALPRLRNYWAAFNDYGIFHLGNSIDTRTWKQMCPTTAVQHIWVLMSS